MPKKKTAQTIALSIESLSANDARPWTKIALITSQVETSGFWEASHRSFTEWLVSFGQDIGLKDASIWRYYRAGKYYQKIQHTLSQNKITNPPLNELPPKISPENIEILGKLERVIPNDLFIKIAALVISEKITRNSLREMWINYRPALNGRTARGMGVPVPCIDLEDKAQYGRLMEAHVFTALSQDENTWLSTQKPHHFELLRGDVARLAMPESKDHYVNAIAIVQMQADGPIEMHGIEIKPNNSPAAKYANLKKVSPYFDFVWVAFQDYDPNVSAKTIPGKFGILQLQGQKITSVRAPSRNKISAEAQLDIAKQIMLSNK